MVQKHSKHVRPFGTVDWRGSVSWGLPCRSTAAALCDLCKNNCSCSFLQFQWGGCESGTNRKKMSKEQRGYHKVCFHLTLIKHSLQPLSKLIMCVCISGIPDEPSAFRQSSKTQSAEAIMDKYKYIMEKRPTHSDGAVAGTYVGQGLSYDNVHTLYRNCRNTLFLQYCEVNKAVMLLTLCSSLIQTLKLVLLDIVPLCSIVQFILVNWFVQMVHGTCKNIKHESHK